MDGSENSFRHCPTDPLRADTDRDRLTDGDEIHGVALGKRLVLRKRTVMVKVVFPDPCRADTDRDGLSDSREVRGSHTRKLGKTYRSHPVRKDSDRDGLSDRQEVTGKANRAYHREPTDPMNRDTDGGGISDGVEVRYGSDPNDRKSGPPSGPGHL